MKRLAPLSALVLSLLVSSCGEESRAPFEPLPPMYDIADAAHIGGNPHFWFLPPFLPPAEFSGVFKASADPRLTICELVDPADPGQGCTDVLLTADPTTKAVFTLNPGPGEQELELSLADEFFRAQWKPSLYQTSTTSTYRVIVEERSSTGAFVVLGWADIQLGENMSSLRRLDDNAVVGFVDNQTANIPFRIEEGSLPCDGVTTPCALGVWVSGPPFILRSQAPAAGPAQLFIPAGTTITAADGTVLDAVLFSLSQKTGTSGCFDNLLINDPGLNPSNGNEPEVCWEVVAYDPVTQERLTVTFGSPDGSLPSLAFCPSPYVVQQELANPGSFNGASVPDDVAGQTITVLPDGSLPLGDPAYPGDPEFGFTVGECQTVQSGLGAVGQADGELVGQLAMLALRTLDFLRPRPLWAVNGGFVLQLPGTSTIYFPTTLPQAISTFPPDPIRVGDAVMLTAAAVHHDLEVGSTLNLGWTTDDAAGAVLTVGSDGTVTGIGAGRALVTATVLPFVGSSGITGVLGADGAAVSSGTEVIVAETLPCDGVTTPCTFGLWDSEETFFVESDASGAGPSQLFIPGGVSATVNGQPVEDLMFSLRQQTGTAGCFDNLLVADPGLDPAHGGEPQVCWELLAVDPVTQNRLSVTFNANDDGALPSLAFCPEPFVAQQELANPGLFNVGSVPDDIAGQTITVMDETSLPLNDPNYPGDGTFSFTAQECLDRQASQVGMGSVAGTLASLVGRGLDFFGPKPLWAVNGGFVLQLPGTATIYFPTTTPEAISVVPPEPIEVGETAALSPVAVHHDLSASVRTLSLNWLSGNTAFATVGLTDGTVAGVSPGEVTITATVAPFPNSSGIDGILGADGAAVSASVALTVQAADPCDDVTNPCVFGTWDSGQPFFAGTEAAGAGPAQVFIPSGVEATVGGEPVDDILFTLRQQSGANGCFSNLLIADPGLDPAHEGEPQVCWELLALDPATQERLEVTFLPNDAGALPSLAFCPEPYVVQQELANPGLYNGGSVPDDIAGQTITVMDETSLPLGDPDYSGDATFSFTAQECLDAQASQVGMGSGGVVGTLASLVGRGLDLFGPKPLWAVNGGFVLQLPGTATIYFPTTTPEAVSMVPPEPIVVGQTTALSPVALHRNAEVSARVLSLIWASSNVSVATVGTDGTVTGIASGQSNIQATVAPFLNSSGITGIADADGLAISTSVAVTVEAAVPDLVVTSWAGDQISRTLVAGQPVVFDGLSIKNEGTATAAPFSFEIRLWDAPPTDATTSFLLDLGTVPGGLASEATATLFPDPAIPEAVPPGTGYYIGVVLDTQNDVPEGDAGEANNVVFSGPITIEPPPSLTISFVQQPTNTLSGQAISPDVSVSVTDPAGAPVPGVSVTLSNAGTGIACGLTSQSSSITDAAGIATFSGLAVQRSCRASIQAEAQATGATATSDAYLIFAGGRGTATIDGVLDPGEWDGALCFDAPSVLFGTGATMTTCFMNDSENLYVNTTVTRDGDLIPQLDIKLDMDGDEVVGPAGYDEGDDVWNLTVLASGVAFSDRYGSGGIAPRDEQQDGSGTRTRSGVGEWVFEVSHPLDSGETGRDVALAEGDWIDVGVQLSFFIPGGGGTDSHFRLPNRTDGLKWFMFPQPTTGDVITLPAGCGLLSCGE